MAREASKFAPKFEGASFQYHYLIEARAMIQSFGFAEGYVKRSDDPNDIGPEPLERLSDEAQETYMWRLYHMVENFMELDFSAQGEPLQGLQSNLMDYLKDAPYMKSHCYSYAVDSDIQNPSIPGASIEEGTVELDGSFTLSDEYYEKNYSEIPPEFHVETAIKADGLIDAKLDPNGLPIAKDGETIEESFFLVALYINPDDPLDYHVLTENQVGWSAQLEPSGAVQHYADVEYPHLSDREELTLGGRVEFQGYFYAPAEKVNVGSEVNPNLLDTPAVLPNFFPDKP